MYWVIALTVFIGGAILSWIALDRKWNNLVGPPPTLLMEEMIRLTRRFHPDIPGLPRFIGLKCSIIRHAFVSIVSAVLIYFLGDSGIVMWVIWPLNALYAYTVVGRYSYRKKLLAKIALEREASTVELCAKLIRASKICVTYTLVSAALLMIFTIFI